jgi:hypothetical protein
MNTEIRGLTDADLDRVSGGWAYCPLGTKSGGQEGVYADGAPCATQTYMQVVAAGVLAGAQKAAAK